MKISENTKESITRLSIIAGLITLLVGVIYLSYYETYIPPVEILKEGIRESGYSYIERVKK